MDSASIERLRRIVLAVASTPPDERSEKLALECGDDAELRAAVLRLLRFDMGESTLDLPEGRSGGIGEHTSVEPPAIAEGIPGYRVLRKLGEGGMGTVYLAEDEKLRRAVALKFLRPELVGGADALARFLREARAAAAVDHPNVCTVYGINETRGQMFIEMAHVEGETLRQRIASGPLTIDDSVVIALQIARGLGAAHQKGIIHRDLKPSNVMLSTGGLVKIMDFGLARSREHSAITRTGARMGTIRYMSPEQLRGEPADHRTDVWAFGVVLFEMLAGRLPFRGDSDPALGYNVVHEKPCPLLEARGDAPPVLADLIERCLEKKPGDRLDAADIVPVLEALRPSSGSTSIVVPRLRRRRTRAGAIAVLSLLAVLAAVGWWRGWFPAGREITPREPRLTRLTALPDPESSSLLPGSISPDGSYLALPLRHLDGSRAALEILSIETGQARNVSEPAGEVYSVRWMPDSETLLTFEYQGDLPWRERSDSDDSRSQIWLRNIVLNTGRKIYEHPKYTTTLWPVSSPDGTTIAMYRGSRRAVWTLDATGENLRKIREVPSGELIHSLVWSPDGSRVAYARSHDDLPGRAVSIETCSLEGDTTVVLAGDPGIDPGREDATLCWLPDGRLIFSRWTDFLRTTAALWSLPVDPATGLRRGDPEPFLEIDGAALGQPTVSADGRRMTVYGWKANMRPRLLELSAGGDSAGVGRWTSQDWPAYPGVWTRDGRGLFFTVEMSKGDCDIYRWDMDRKLEEPVVNTPEQECGPCLTPDGSALLFWQGDRLERMPLDGGPAKEIFRSPTPVVTLSDAIDRVMCPDEPGSRCVLKRVEGDSTVFYGFDPRNGEVQDEIARVGFRLKPPEGRCDLSPDGTRMAIVANGTLSVLDLGDGSMRRLVTDWSGVPTTAFWSRDGSWLCVTGMRGVASMWMRRVDLDGTSRILCRTDAFGIAGVARPSPDGSCVAFATYPGETNVWMVEDF